LNLVFDASWSARFRPPAFLAFRKSKELVPYVR
jgi:hypothetical protein